MKTNSNAFPIPTLREDLRLRSCALAARLSRSVARLTSCDSQPCLEYGDEVRTEQELATRLFYLQHCRDALEKCIGGSRVTVRYRWSDGTVTRTAFRKDGPNRVKVTGFRTV